MKNPTKQTIRILLAVLLFSLISTVFVYAASAETMTVTAEATTSQVKVGDILTVNIKISNAQNLFGLDVNLNWNPSVLDFVSATPLLGVESHPQGVLHESSSYPIEVDDSSQTGGQYHLLATSTGQSTPGFSGSGTIVTVTFNVTASGSAGLGLTVELAQFGNTEVVVPFTSVDSVTIVIPEFPTIAFIIVLLIAASAAVVVSAKLYKHKPVSSVATRF
jgi:hypothetical protein